MSLADHVVSFQMRRHFNSRFAEVLIDIATAEYYCTILQADEELYISPVQCLQNIVDVAKPQEGEGVIPHCCGLYIEYIAD